MSWSIGYDERWKRDIGNGVPAVCDHPDCNEVIDRGHGYACGGEPYGGDDGCGLYFCGSHLHITPNHRQRCEQCISQMEPFAPKPDVNDWVNRKMTDERWAEWRKNNAELVAKWKAENEK